MDKNSMMESYARKAYETGSFNGTWLYAENGEIISKGACGWRDPENRLPMTEDTIFEMASITKQFTAAAVMLLAREGRLSLDDEYTKFFPEFPFPGVRIRHLLTHTSGIPDYDVEAWVAPILEKEKRIPPCGEVIRFICESGQEPVGAPGEKFSYSDIGYTLLANAVEKVSGTAFEVFLKEKLFAPAGMKDTAICHTRRDGIPSDRFARNLVLEDDGYVPSDLSKRTAGYVVGSDGLNGCDYAYTTLFDMLAWDRALRAGRIVTLEEQRQMYTPVRLNSGEVYADEDGDGYGFGWGVANDEALGLIVRHGGGMPGLNTWFERYIDDDRVLLLFDCRDPQDIRAFESFWDGMRAIAKGEAPEPIVTIEDIAVKAPDRSKWAGFCGKYEHKHTEDEDFIIDGIFMKDGELCANALIDGCETTFRLYPTGENAFGRKRGFLRLTFGDGCLMYDDLTCKKL